MVQVIWMVVLTLITFTIGYVGYSRYLARFVDLDDDRETPAHEYEDGQEYVPSKKPVLLGHHYSSIAGGAPIVGPITAAAAYGWLPAILWVAIGNPILGAVHDFMSLSGSLRHEGKSIGYIMGEYVGERGKNMLLWFAFLTIILVLAVFAFVIAVVFDAFPSAATASIIYLGLAFLFGLYLYQFDLPFIPGTVVFVAGVFASVWVGIQYPIALFARPDLASDVIVLFGNGGEWLPLAAGQNPNTAAWVPVVIIYAFVASVLPVWVLLQPRDYLSSFLLYAGVGGMLLGIVVGTLGLFEPVTVNGSTYTLSTQLPAFTGLYNPALGPIFPFLFVTIACGTISGFHSLVSSGTTAKQLNKESDARTIGYGGMLGEGLLAATATAAIAMVASTAFLAGGSGLTGALANFPTGGAVMISSFGIPFAYGAPFIGLVFVSFLLTSTDTALRLGRYMFEEIVDTPETSVQEAATNRYVNAGIQGVVGYVLVASGTWGSLWPLFGGANQLLAALALLTATVWLVNWDESKQLLSTGGPLVLMFVVTIVALLWVALVKNPQNLLNASSTFAAVSFLVQIVLALVLAGLGLALLWIGYGNIRETRESGAVAADGGEPSDD